MSTLKPLSIAILSDFALEVDAQGWMKILPFGQFNSTDGRPFDAPYWDVSNATGERLAAQLNNIKIDKVVDYEHQTLNAAKNGKEAPASGWLKAKNYKWVADLGLFSRVKWTPRATTYIENDEYRYLSPVFTYDPNGVPQELLHVALTNTPALDNLTDLLAVLSQLYPQSNKTETPKMEALKLLNQLLGLPEDADDAATTAALNVVINQVTENKGLAACSTSLADFIKGNQDKIVALSANQVDPTKHAPVDGVKALQLQVALLSQQLADKEKAEQTKEATALVTAALSDGRLLPALEGWALSLAATNVAALNQYLDAAQPIAALTQQQTKGQPPDGDKPKLTESQLAVCSAIGVSPEEYLKNLNGDNQ